MWPNPQESADLVIFTEEIFMRFDTFMEEILNGKLFLYSETVGFVKILYELQP